MLARLAPPPPCALPPSCCALPPSCCALPPPLRPRREEKVRESGGWGRQRAEYGRVWGKEGTGRKNLQALESGRW
eukprot:751736-Hanusia_phi.AAC.4